MAKAHSVATPRAELPLIWSLAPALVGFGLYLLMLPTSPGDKDAGEFTLALALGGVPHPTGYPLYLLGGHLFVQAMHALGLSWATAANAWSAVGGAVAVFFLHAIIYRLTPGTQKHRWWLAFLPTALFAFSPLWTYEVVLAEVYSWHLAWVCGCALLFVTLDGILQRGATFSRRRGLQLAFAWGVCCGLGGAHHTTAILVAAPLSLALAWRGFRHGTASVMQVALVLAGALLALSSYGLIVWKAFHPAAWQWPTLEPSLASVFRHLSGGAYGQFFGEFQPSVEQQALLRHYIYPLLSISLVVHAVGAFRQEQIVSRVLFVSACLSLAFALSYGVPDPSSYFLAPLALALVGAWVELSRWVATQRWLQFVAAAVVIALASLWFEVGIARKRTMDAYEQHLRSMWTSIPQGQAFVLWPNEMHSRLVGYQLLEGEKKELEIVNPMQLGESAVRRRFEERFGFNPLEGVEVQLGPHHAPDPEDLALKVGRVINARSAWPVILFQPQTGSVRMLRKP